MVAVVSALHFLIFFGSFLLSFGASMERLDTGEPANLIETLLNWATEILGFPVLTLLDFMPWGVVPGALDLVPFALNSLVWGCVIAFVLSRGGGGWN